VAAAGDRRLDDVPAAAAAGATERVLPGPVHVPCPWAERTGRDDVEGQAPAPAWQVSDCRSNRRPGGKIGIVAGSDSRTSGGRVSTPAVSLSSGPVHVGALVEPGHADHTAITRRPRTESLPTREHHRPDTELPGRAESVSVPFPRRPTRAQSGRRPGPRPQGPPPSSVILQAASRSADDHPCRSPYRIHGTTCRATVL
jgi:hypothetical protein